MSTDLAKTDTTISLVVDVKTHIPDLSKCEDSAVDLLSEYWTPKSIGETRRMIFDRIDTQLVKKMDSDQMIELLSAFFVQPIKKDGVGDSNDPKDYTMKIVSNGSSRLVSALENASAQRGEVFTLVYLGKEKNKTNSFSSDNWSIRRVIAPVQ